MPIDSGSSADSRIRGAGAVARCRRRCAHDVVVRAESVARWDIGRGRGDRARRLRTGDLVDAFHELVSLVVDSEAFLLADFVHSLIVRVVIDPRSGRPMRYGGVVRVTRPTKWGGGNDLLSAPPDERVVAVVHALRLPGGVARRVGEWFAGGPISQPRRGERADGDARARTVRAGHPRHRSRAELPDLDVPANQGRRRSRLPPDQTTALYVSAPELYGCANRSVDLLTIEPLTRAQSGTGSGSGVRRPEASGWGNRRGGEGSRTAPTEVRATHAYAESSASVAL